MFPDKSAEEHEADAGVEDTPPSIVARVVEVELGFHSGRWYAGTRLSLAVSPKITI